MKSFSFSNPWLLLIALPLVFLTVLTFLRLSKTRRTKKYLVSVILRCIAFVLIVAMLAGMSSISATDDVSIIVLADLSDSTLTVRSDMEDFVQELVESVDSDIEIGLVAFADGYVYEAELGSDMDFSDFTEEPAASATDIEDALRYASSLLPTDTYGRIILLSDGEQTEGDAEAAAVEIAYQEIRIDAVLFDTESDGDEIQIDDVEMPESAYSGDTFEITVTAESNTNTAGTLLVYDNDTLIGEVDISIKEGINTYTVEDTAAESGVHSFRIELAADDDSLTENNTYYSYIKILGDPNILIIDGTGSESQTLTQILDDDYNVTIVTESEAPSTLAELYDYDEVVLMNVSCDDLPDGFDEVLEEYISVLGRGVLTTGGTDTYYYGAMTGTAFDDFLPVDVDLGDDDGNAEMTALVILIDSSSSMSGTSYELAKEGAINCVNALSSSDYVGIIAFADKSYVVSELTSAENKDDVVEAISELETVRGTYLCDAVKEAYDQLKESDADVKHVIIISDGNPSDTGYDAVVEDMYASDITTSTILIGDGTSYSMGNGAGSFAGGSTTSDIMEELAELGGGDFYEVSDVSDLPDIMVEETEQYLTNYISEGTFTPEINNISQVLSGVDAIPSLDGYVITEIKSTASSVLYTDANRPVYAEWDYGNGSVASFTSDLSGQWSSTFLASEEGITFIQNVVSSLLPSESDMTGLDVDITRNGTETTMVVETTDASEDTTVEASVVSPDGEEYTATLNVSSEGVYTNMIDASAEGVYTVLVLQSDSAGTITAYTDTAFAASYSAEYDAFMTGGDSLLNSVSSITDGEVMTDAEDLLNIDIDPVEIEKSLLIPLSILAALLLLADLILRNTKWKDLCGFFRRIKEK